MAASGSLLPVSISGHGDSLAILRADKLAG